MSKQLLQHESGTKEEEDAAEFAAGINEQVHLTERTKDPKSFFGIPKGTNQIGGLTTKHKVSD